MLVYKDYENEQHIVDLEWAWTHALCCILPTQDSLDPRGWWACEIIEAASPTEGAQS